MIRVVLPFGLSDVVCGPCQPRNIFRCVGCANSINVTSVVLSIVKMQPSQPCDGIHQNSMEMCGVENGVEVQMDPRFCQANIRIIDVQLVVRWLAGPRVRESLFSERRAEPRVPLRLSVSLSGLSFMHRPGN